MYSEARSGKVVNSLSVFSYQKTADGQEPAPQIFAISTVSGPHTEDGRYRVVLLSTIDVTAPPPQDPVQGLNVLSVAR